MSSSSELNIVEFDNLDENVQQILQEAVKAREFAYAPYSNFKVGAGLLCSDGEIYGGCNIENVSFTVGTCAERTAYGKAISEGKQTFSAIAVIADFEFTTPCGACRQYMSEFGSVDIYVAKPSLEKVLVTNLDKILPLAFSASDNPLGRS